MVKEDTAPLCHCVQLRGCGMMARMKLYKHEDIYDHNSDNNHKKFMIMITLPVIREVHDLGLSLNLNEI